MDRGKENEQGKNNLPWQHLESNPIEREFHDELPPRHTQSGPDTGESRALAPALLFLLVRGDAGMRSLEKGGRPLLLRERGREAAKPSTERTSTHEERED